MMLQASLQVRLRLDLVDELWEVRGYRFCGKIHLRTVRQRGAVMHVNPERLGAVCAP